MKKNIFKKIVLKIALSIILIVIGGGCYWPFVQMKDIDAEAYWGNRFDDSIHDRIQVQLTRFQLYPTCWFIHKGDSYTDVLLHDNYNVQQKMDIKFNWDNSITISKGTDKFAFHVSRIEIRKELFPYPYNYDDYYPIKQHETDDSLYVGIFMYDNKKNEIAIYRQKRTMPYKGKRVGFCINIDGRVLLTGKESLFDY